MSDDRDLVRSAGGPIRFEASVGGRSRTPAVLVMVAVAFVAAFIVRPWQPASLPAAAASATSSGTSAAPPAARGTKPAAASGPSASERAVQAFCLDPGSWRTATIEQWRTDQTVRVWRAVEPRPATGPTDPGIDVVPAVGESVPAIGYCAPTIGLDRPTGPAGIAAWRVDGANATPIDLRRMAPIGARVGAGRALRATARCGGRLAERASMSSATRSLESHEARWFAVEVKTYGPSPTRGTRPPPSAVMQPGGGLGAFFLP